MISDLVPSSFWSFPTVDDDTFLPSVSSGLSVSEDDDRVYVEAAVPGIDPDKVDVTVDNGTLWIKGEEEHDEEKKSKRRYYRGYHAASYAYRVLLPEEVDDEKEPEAKYKNGKMYLTFTKKAKAQPKKITVKV